MKSRVLGLACAAGLAAGCQSSAAKALSRYEASKEKGNEVSQASHSTPAGLPGAANRRTEPTPQTPAVAFEAGEKALQQFYRDKQDKPAHLQRARMSFEAAAKLEPTHAAAQHRLAIVADLQERFGESESYYRTALSLDPGNSNIAADMGWSFILQGRWQDAERALQRALELDPNSSIARDHLAKCRQHQPAAQFVSTERAQPGQMVANRPATVGAANGAAPSQWDERAAAQRGPWGAAPGVAPDLTGEYLRNQLSQVDRYGGPSAGQPLTLGPNPQNNAAAYAPPPQQPAAPPVQPQFSPQFQPTAPQFASNAVPQNPPVQQSQSPMGAAPAGFEQQPVQRSFTHYEPGGPVMRSNPGDSQGPEQRDFGNAATAYRAPQAGRQEWANSQAGTVDPIQRAQAIETPRLHDQAMYQASEMTAQPTAMPDVAASFRQPRPSAVPQTGYGQSPDQQVAGDRRPTAAALEKARRDAALMGLGLGPGQPFSNLEQPSDRVSPGSYSQIGAAFAPTPVQSPDLTPPPDLRQQPSFFEQGPVTPPTNSMGQSMPGGTSTMMTPGSVNDPHAQFRQAFVSPASGQMPQLPPAPNTWRQGNMQGGMQGYDDTRRIADHQLQQTLQSTWAGTPSGAIPSPAGGVPYQTPPPQSQMMNESWGRQPVAPAPYPHTSQQPQNNGRSSDFAPLPSVNPSASRMPVTQPEPFAPVGRPAQPAYRDGIVIPEQYGQQRP
ncbi:Tetratricopeptide repeat protein [Caulifigura coniformis]|uniref:Tetratricopeptide repeat protein n=1 Tax=Caulifigura coniformis TaxID=2527983 RepID=A0A517SGE0_9PLAN|nr:tetratricopeptide repeat protein [Caulifigura coniformis]QDT55192.1 Tetratricopeptide repeat protein [Caulifigura coniformis]